MEINCPSCDEAVLIADEDMTETFECPFCQQRIEIEKPKPRFTPDIRKGMAAIAQGEVVDPRVPPPVEKPPLIPVEPAKSAQTQSGEKTFLYGMLQRQRWPIYKHQPSKNIFWRLVQDYNTWIQKITNNPLHNFFIGTLWSVTENLGVSGNENGSVGLTVLVTDKRVVLGSKTYALKQISSVKIVSSAQVPWLRLFGLERGPFCWVEIESSSRKEKALLCNTEEDAQKITYAINQAIIDN